MEVGRLLRGAVAAYCSNVSLVFSVIDRVLLVAWLLKDFGWMTTNVYMAYPFGVLSVSCHFLLMLLDPRKSYRFYNVSLFLWVSGNFIWMTIEFLTSKMSSSIHLGPPVPLDSSITAAQANVMIDTKNYLFLIGSLVQCGMYVGIYMGGVQMPLDDEEDKVARREMVRLLNLEVDIDEMEHSQSSKAMTGRSNSESIGSSTADNTIVNNPDYSDPTRSSSSGNSAVSIDSQSPSSPGRGRALSSADEIISKFPISCAFVEYFYIVFWISKDMFWSWGTGDLIQGEASAVLFETCALCFGTLSFCVYTVTAYIYRFNHVRFVDALTTLCWIAANFVWMSGEFFIRYQNLELDDSDEGNDGATRVASAVLFSAGLALQTYIVIRMALAPSGRLGLGLGRSAAQRYVSMSSIGSDVISIQMGSVVANKLHHSSLRGDEDEIGDDDDIEIINLQA